MSTSDSNSKSEFNAWWFAAAALVAGVVIALVVVLVASPGDDASTPAAAPTFSEQPEAIPDPEENAGASCSVPGGTQEIPRTGPAAEWVTDALFLQPISNEFGPITREGSTWGCFQHSPTGALFAAATAFEGLGSPDYASFVEAAAEPSMAADEWVASQDPASRTQKAGAVAQISGFRFISSSSERHILELAVTQETISARMILAMNWSSTQQTWLIDFDSTDLEWARADLAGFTEWGAFSA